MTRKKYQLLHYTVWAGSEQEIWANPHHALLEINRIYQKSSVRPEPAP
jgi:hypothetical protein